MPHYKIIFISMTDPDDTGQGYLILLLVLLYLPIYVQSYFDITFWNKAYFGKNENWHLDLCIFENNAWSLKLYLKE